jgi:pyrroloquinoline quinone biosynthesis protein B
MGLARAIVLGSAAGGGFPQWNCGCSGCRAARAGEDGWTPRTQDSVALSADGERFVLVNASPDVLVQIQRTPALWARRPRHSPIAAVVLTNGDLDHVLGLFSLRESTPLALYATDAVLRGLEASVLMKTMRRFDGQLRTRPLRLGEDVEVADAGGEALGVRVRPFALPGKLPIHLSEHARPGPEDNVGLSMRASRSSGGGALAYASACASLDDVDLSGHDVVLFDGTFFREDELVRLGLGTASARDMAHVPMSGPEGSLARLASLRARKIYTHVNNTNPVLGPTDERAVVLESGWEIATDGMEITL